MSARSTPERPIFVPFPSTFSTRHGVYVTLALACSTLIALQFSQSTFGDSVAAILYLFFTVLSALRSGLGTALWSALLSSLLLACLFLPPQGTLHFIGLSGAMTASIFLLVAVATAHLAAAAHNREIEAAEREHRTAALYDLSMVMSIEAELNQVLRHLAEKAVAICGLRSCAIYRYDGEYHLCGEVNAAATSGLLAMQQVEIASRVEALEAPQFVAGEFFVPLQYEGNKLGILIAGGALELNPSQQSLLLTAGNHAAVAIRHEQLAHLAAEAHALLEIERLKASLLASVSHDLRTPLASIKASASDLCEADTELACDGATRQRAENILRNTDRLDRMVSNLLNLSRLEAGAWQPNQELHSMAEILVTVVGRLDEGETQRVRVEVPDDLPLVMVDEQQIEQVLWNLVENALKYSPPASPVELRVGMRGEELEVRLRDHGSGIPNGEETRIFEKFYRAHRGESSVPGVGVGLSICKEVLEAHQGSISVANASDGGAIFTFYLPLKGTKEHGKHPGSG